MKIYQHILLTTDLSDQSYSLGQKAKSIAKQFNAKLSIVHVIEKIPPIYGSGEFNFLIDIEPFEKEEQQAKVQLSVEAKKLDIMDNDQWLISGSKIEEITVLAKKIQVDLIVVGAHDKHGLSLLFGSTADSILHALPCDILSIRVED